MKLFNNSKRITSLENQVEILVDYHTKLQNDIQDRDVYMAIGMHFMSRTDKHIQLLMKATSKGFFMPDNCFTSAGENWKDGTYFKHHYSNIASNYSYHEEKDSLRIPVIGVMGNFSACSLVIYKKGKWSSIVHKSKLEEKTS